MTNGTTQIDETRYRKLKTLHLHTKKPPHIQAETQCHEIEAVDEGVSPHAGNTNSWCVYLYIPYHKVPYPNHIIYLTPMHVPPCTPNMRRFKEQTEFAGFRGTPDSSLHNMLVMAKLSGAPGSYPPLPRVKTEYTLRSCDSETMLPMALLPMCKPGRGLWPTPDWITWITIKVAKPPQGGIHLNHQFHYDRGYSKGLDPCALPSILGFSRLPANKVPETRAQTPATSSR